MAITNNGSFDDGYIGFTENLILEIKKTLSN